MMAWIVLTVLFMLAAWAAFGVWYFVRRSYPERKARWEETKYGDKPIDYSPAFLWSGVAVVVIWGLISLFFMFHTVGQREVAIVYNFSGTIAGKKDPGVVTTWPWQHVKKENVGIQHDEWVFAEGNSAVSNDQQPIFGRLSVNYQIDSVNVVDLYKRVGASWKTIIIDARVPQVFKEITATFTTPNITQQREKLRQNTRERLTSELKPYDIRVVDVFITNLGFSRSYTDAIEAKQKQVQDAERQKAKIQESQAIAKQKIAEANGEAQANIAIARGDAQANRLRQRSLTPRLIQWEAIQKLNPKAQLIICPPGAVCVPNTFVPTGGGNGP
jgi:regulator of protease activity HflC (stomatin/prohibitin superfamily)